MNKLAVFDCDGTLVDSGGNIHSALSHAFVEHGFDVPAPEVSRRVIGLSLVEAMAALLPDVERDRHLELAESYKLHFQRARLEGRVEEPLFEGIPELLDAGMAVAAGATGIGAGWGYHEAAELLEAGAAAVADAPLDVLGLLNGEGTRRYG